MRGLDHWITEGPYMSDGGPDLPTCHLTGEPCPHQGEECDESCAQAERQAKLLRGTQGEKDAMDFCEAVLSAFDDD